MDQPKLVTTSELEQYGIDPTCPSMSKRIALWPVTLRWGDDKIERTVGGRVMHFVNYYNPNTEETRRILRNSMLRRLYDE